MSVMGMDDVATATAADFFFRPCFVPASVVAAFSFRIKINIALQQWRVTAKMIKLGTVFLVRHFYSQ